MSFDSFLKFADLEAYLSRRRFFEVASLLFSDVLSESLLLSLSNFGTTGLELYGLASSSPLDMLSNAVLSLSSVHLFAEFALYALATIRSALI